MAKQFTIAEFKKLTKSVTPKKKSSNTDLFELYANNEKLSFEKEVKFCERRWRTDFMFSRQGKMIAVEIEGGVYSNGRHTRGKGFEGDIEKYNTYTLLGIYLLRFTTAQIEKEPAKCVDTIKEALQF